MGTKAKKKPAARKSKPKIKAPATDPWAPEETVLAIRTCRPDGSSSAARSFKYPLTPGSVVAAPDWDPTPKCGGGLHVLVDAQGDWGLLDWSIDAKALIVRVRRDELVAIDRAKSKVPRLRIEKITTLSRALCEIACDAATINRVVDRVLVEAKKAGAKPGDAAQLAASGDAAQLAASGYAAQLAASGEDALILGSYEATAKAGPGGCIALAWWDEKVKRPRVSVGYVGEGLKADTWYRVDERGEFEEVKS